MLGRSPTEAAFNVEGAQKGHGGTAANAAHLPSFRLFLVGAGGGVVDRAAVRRGVT